MAPVCSAKKQSTFIVSVSTAARHTEAARQRGRGCAGVTRAAQEMDARQ